MNRRNEGKQVCAKCGMGAMEERHGAIEAAAQLIDAREKAYRAAKENVFADELQLIAMEVRALRARVPELIIERKPPHEDRG